MEGHNVSGEKNAKEGQKEGWEGGCSFYGSQNGKRTCWMPDATYIDAGHYG